MTKHHVLLTLNLSTTDQPLREYCRGDGPLPVAHVQRVICEDARYADRIYAHWINMKIAKNLPAGGGWCERYIDAHDAERIAVANSSIIAQHVADWMRR